MRGAFDIEKSVQIAAQLLELNGGEMDRYVLIKMMYEADRTACGLWGRSMTGDAPISMEHGPVLSRIVSLTKGPQSKSAARWNEIISPPDEDHVLTLKKPIPQKDRLSSRDLKIISAAYQKLNGMSFSGIKRWSHGLKEYSPVKVGAVEPITEETRLKAVGRTPAQIKISAEEDAEDAAIKAAWGR